MNPALDITTGTDVVRPADKLRCGTARYDPGGGGINVAHVAEVLGVPATAVFPAGGPAGELVHSLLVAEGLAVQRVRIGGSTRESFTVNELSTRRQFRFVLPGPQLTVAEQTECLLHLRRAAGSARIVVASGSFLPGCRRTSTSRCRRSARRWARPSCWTPPVAGCPTSTTAYSWSNRVSGSCASMPARN